MNIVLLSGGSGKRLWPLSNDIRSKQFIKIFKNEDGIYESMVQRIFRQINHVDKDSTITIATSKSQVSAINNQLGYEVNICVEPCRRDTFPAIVLATSYLKDVKGLHEEDVVIVCPVDPYVNNDYFLALKKLEELAKSDEFHLALMGMEPTYPSTKYGYIIPNDTQVVSRVNTFKEKPSEDVAKEYLKQGALWNGGVFAYKLKYVLGIAKDIIGFSDFKTLYEQYENLKKISFDYAVVEKEEKIQLLRFAGEWKDLGTWNTLTEAMDEHVVGEAILSDDSKNVHIVNELDVPIVCVGMKNTVIAASAEGILVSDKMQSSEIKPLVDQIDQHIMFAEKSWGNFQVIDIQDSGMTVKVSLKEGMFMNYHSHQFRDEVWIVLSGQGLVCIDGETRLIKCGDVIQMPIGSKHTVKATTELSLMEIQIGKEISVHDKIKYDNSDVF